LFLFLPEAHKKETSTVINSYKARIAASKKLEDNYPETKSDDRDGNDKIILIPVIILICSGMSGTAQSLEVLANLVARGM